MNGIQKFYNKHILGSWLILLDTVYLFFGIVVYLMNNEYMSSLLMNLHAELIGINVTVLIIDAANRKRDERKELAQLFENDIHNYGRYISNIKSKLESIIKAMENNLDSSTVFLLKEDLIIEIENSPLRRSFSNEQIQKEKGERINNSYSYVNEIITYLSSLLKDNEKVSTYKRLLGDLLRAEFSVLELRASNEFIEKHGSILNRDKTINT